MTTIDVTDDYTLKAGKTLSFTNETAFNLTGEGTPELTIAGTVSVSEDRDFISISAINGEASAELATVVITKSGRLLLTDTGDGVACAVRFSGPAEMTNLGFIGVTAIDGTGVGFGAAGGVLHNLGTINVSGRTEGSAQAYGVLGGEFDNSGALEVSCGQFATAFSGLKLENSGLIHVSGNGMLTAVWSHGDIHNSGDILVEATAGTAIGVHVEPRAGSFDNEGSITATGSLGIGVEVGIEDGDAQLLTNSGLISASQAIGMFVEYSAPAITLDNSGQIVGSIALGAADDDIRNSGSITGDIWMSAGDDRYETVGKGKLSGTVYGADGADVLTGGKAAEGLDGGIDADTLAGAGGADTLTGSVGADVFIYQKLTDSAAAKADLITDLESDDLIDLHRIDADTTRDGNQKFELVAKLDGHAGEAALLYDSAHDVTRLVLDVDGDGKGDSLILISGEHTDFTGIVL